MKKLATVSTITQHKFVTVCFINIDILCFLSCSSGSLDYIGLVVLQLFDNLKAAVK